MGVQEALLFVWRKTWSGNKNGHTMLKHVGTNLRTLNLDNKPVHFAHAYKLADSVRPHG